VSDAHAEKTVALSPATSTTGRTVFVQKAMAPVFRGEGQIDFACAHCGNILAERIEPWQIQNCVAECGICRHSSEFAAAPAPIGIEPTRWHATTIYVSEPITVKRGRMHVGHTPDIGANTAASRASR
jgi:hypothetical protein